MRAQPRPRLRAAVPPARRAGGRAAPGGPDGAHRPAASGCPLPDLAPPVRCAGFELTARRPAPSTAVEHWSAAGPEGLAEVYVGPPSLLARAGTLPIWGPFPEVRTGRLQDGRSFAAVLGTLAFDLEELTQRLAPGAAVAFAWHITSALAEVHERGGAHGALHPSFVGLDARGRLTIRPAFAASLPSEPDPKASAQATDCLQLDGLLDVLDLDRIDEPALALVRSGLAKDRARFRIQPGRSVRQALSAVLARHPDWEASLIESLGVEWRLSNALRMPPKPQPSPELAPVRVPVVGAPSGAHVLSVAVGGAEGPGRFGEAPPSAPSAPPLSVQVGAPARGPEPAPAAPRAPRPPSPPTEALRLTVVPARPGPAAEVSAAALPVAPPAPPVPPPAPPVAPPRPAEPPAVEPPAAVELPPERPASVALPLEVPAAVALPLEVPAAVALPPERPAAVELPLGPDGPPEAAAPEAAAEPAPEPAPPPVAARPAAALPAAEDVGEDDAVEVVLSATSLPPAPGLVVVGLDEEGDEDDDDPPTNHGGLSPRVFGLDADDDPLDDASYEERDLLSALSVGLSGDELGFEPSAPSGAPAMPAAPPTASPVPALQMGRSNLAPPEPSGPPPAALPAAGLPLPPAPLPPEGDDEGPRWASAGGVTGDARREAELGAGKWTEPARTAEEVRSELGAGPAREIPPVDEGRGSKVFLIIGVVAVLGLVAWWALGG